MKILKVPYAEKDQAKALGARWNKERKLWYVPEGTASAPFARWLGAEAEAEVKVKGKGLPARVDAHAGQAVVGANFFVLTHDCNPFLECPQCQIALAAAGWSAARAEVARVVAALT